MGMRTLKFLPLSFLLAACAGNAVDSADGAAERALTASPRAAESTDLSPPATPADAGAAPATTPSASNPSPDVQPSAPPSADAGPPPAQDAGLPPGVVLVADHRVNVGLFLSLGDVGVGTACATDADCALGWCGPAIRIVPLICEPVNSDGHLRIHSACNADAECSQEGGAAVCRDADYPHCPHVIPPHAQCCRPGADGDPCDPTDPIDPDPCRFDPLPADGGA